MADTFTADVTKWVAETEDRTEAVFKQSAQDVIGDAQRPKAKGGRMPVVTGNLRNSHVSGLNGSTALTGADSYVLTIAKAKLGDAITGGWTAAYAARIEYGFNGTDSLGRTYNQAPQFFLRGAAQKWKQFVDKNAAKAMARSG